MKMEFCTCATPVISDDRLTGEDVTARLAEYAICAECKSPIERTAAIADLTGEAEIEPSEFNFAATPPVFPQPINPWANGQFDQQAEWLLKKREQCLDDLFGLQRLLDCIRGSAQERSSAFVTTMKQLKGAYREIAKIEQMIGAIDPNFRFCTLPPPPPAAAIERRALQSLTRNAEYYAEGFSHAA